MKGEIMNKSIKRLAAVLIAAAMVFTTAFASEGTVYAKQVARIRMDSTENGSYSGYHAVIDHTYMYKQSQTAHVVSLQNNVLTDYTLAKNYSVKSRKMVNLPKYHVWGGYFHSEHGQNYVALGYNNPKEKADQTVIRVIQYDKNWHKKKVAEIKGSASNGPGKGISLPFYVGNVSFAEYANTLYMFTSRKIFGANNQTNIGFAIDTRNMKAVEDNHNNFTSHSFNQFCKFGDGNLYQVDQGDGNPRGVKVYFYDGYGKFASDVGVGGHRGGVVVFTFLGEKTNNYTGAKISGLELSSKNVLVTGTAQPHNSSIDGVSGFSSSYGENLYLVKRDRSSNTGSVRWLTNYNPKTSGMSVDRSRFVKISSNRFAIIYSVLNKSTNARTCYCMIIDGEGKTLKNTEYKNIQFRGGTQPIVMGNKIVFAERPSNGKAQIYEIPTK